MSEKEQKDWILGKIGDPVHFTYPVGEGSLDGTLKDRFTLRADGADSVSYWTVIDLIEFKGEDEDWMRISYYRYKAKEGHWVFAGQTSFAGTKSHFRDVFVAAAKEKPWLREVLSDILRRAKVLP